MAEYYTTYSYNCNVLSPPTGANFRARLIVVNVAWFAYEMNYAAPAELPPFSGREREREEAWYPILN